MGRRGWWRRSLDHYFRVLEGEHHKIRDVDEIAEGWRSGSSKLNEEVENYRIQFQQGVEKYRVRSGRRMLLAQYLDAEAKEEGVVVRSKRYKLKTFRKWEEE